MAESFSDLRGEMGEARDRLRKFTLGHGRLTPKTGEAAISRVSDLCAQMQELFGAGSHAGEVASTVVMARNQILAARARLVILGRKKVLPVTRKGEKQSR
jgi:hypothetical protein